MPLTRHPTHLLNRSADFHCINPMELLQAIDRLRLIHNPEEKQVILLSNLVLDIDVDVLGTWDEIIECGNRLERAWKRQTNGVLPLSPEWLTKTYPDFWASEGAAKKDVLRSMKKGQNPNMMTIGHLSLFLLEYRPERQLVWSRCLSNTPNFSQVATALSKIFENPVSIRCDSVGC